MQRANSNDSLFVNFTGYGAEGAQDRINALREKDSYSFEDIVHFFEDFEVIYEQRQDKVALLSQYLPPSLDEHLESFILLHDEYDAYIYQKVKVFLMTLPIQVPLFAVLIKPEVLGNEPGCSASIQTSSDSEIKSPVVKRAKKTKARIYYSDEADTEPVSSSSSSSISDYEYSEDDSSEESETGQFVRSIKQVRAKKH